MEQIEEELLKAADDFKQDLRWLFAFGHGQITKQINQNIKLFRRPNALIKLNVHFAEEFLRAIGGQLHDLWQRAFRVCAALQNTSGKTIVLVGEVEVCGAGMAKVHIDIDLAAAIRNVGCIPLLTRAIC